MDLRYNTAYPLYLLARMLFLSQRDAEKALISAEESLRLSKEIGHKRLIAFVLDLLGQILLQRGEDARANTLAAESTAIFKVLGDRFGEAEAMITLARVAFFQRKLTEAHTLYEESWALLREINAKDLSATCIEGWGEVLAAQGALRPAVRLWGLAATLRAEVGAPKPPVYRVSYGQAVATTRAKLGLEAFAAAWAEGRTMPVEQALVA
jgi:tetratricopeptide (TPR) repeat protein